MGTWHAADFSDGGCDGNCDGCSDCRDPLDGISHCVECKRETEELVENPKDWATWICRPCFDQIQQGKDEEPTAEIALFCSGCRTSFPSLATMAFHPCSEAAR